MHSINVSFYHVLVDLLLRKDTQINFQAYVRAGYKKTNRFTQIIAIPIDTRRDQEVHITWLDPDYILCVYIECIADDVPAFMLFYTRDYIQGAVELISFGDGIINDSDTLVHIHQSKKKYDYTYEIYSVINNHYLNHIMIKAGVLNMQEIMYSKQEYNSYTHFLKLWNYILCGTNRKILYQVLDRYRLNPDIIPEILKYNVKYEYIGLYIA